MNDLIISSREIESRFRISEEGTVLTAEFTGVYPTGSLGNQAGMYMFAMLVKNYFYTSPICIILDLSQLEYSWGDTISSSLNFFCEVGRDKEEMGQKMVIVFSEKNQNSLIDLCSNFSAGNRSFCNEMREAIEIAELEVAEYLK